MQFDRYSKAVLTVIAVALAVIAVGQFRPGPVVAQQTPAGESSITVGNFQVASPERDFAWVVTPNGFVWFCQAPFRGDQSGCQSIDPVLP
jgi:hypothetical protein